MTMSKKEYQNWGNKNQSRLVVKRPEERYYPQNFIGKPETSYKRNNDYVVNEAKRAKAAALKEKLRAEQKQYAKKKMNESFDQSEKHDHDFFRYYMKT